MSYEIVSVMITYELRDRLGPGNMIVLREWIMKIKPGSCNWRRLVGGKWEGLGEYDGIH